MPDQSPSPALSDDELRETLDLMATAVASMSNRIDDLTGVADKQIKVSTEARIAAFAARDQTDPKHYGELVGETIDGKIRETLSLIVQSVNALDQKTNQTVGVLAQAEKDKWDVINAIRAREAKVERFKSHLPWFGLGAVVLALTMAVALPRFLASNGTTCATMGGEWTRTTSGIDACVFYVE